MSNQISFPRRSSIIFNDSPVSTILNDTSLYATSKNKTPLHDAAEQGDVDKITQLLKNHPELLNQPDEDGRKPIYLTLIFEKIPAFFQLSSKGAELSSNLLQVAAMIEDIRPLYLLVDKDLDLNARDELGSTPLHHAVYKKRLNSLRALIRSGADKFATDIKGQTLLHIAALKKNLEIAKELLLEKLNIDALDCNGETPLFNATFKNNSDMVSFLIEQGADPTLSNKKGKTLLYNAVLHKKNEEMILQLYAKGVDPNARNKEGYTSLHYAVRFGDAEAVSTLLGIGADPNLPNDEGNTPLHIAVYNDKKEMISVLLQHGAEADKLNEANETPLFSALKREKIDLIQEFIAYLIDHPSSSSLSILRYRESNLKHANSQRALMNSHATSHCINAFNLAIIDVVPRNEKIKCIFQLFRDFMSPSFDEWANFWIESAKKLDLSKIIPSIQNWYGRYKSKKFSF